MNSHRSHPTDRLGFGSLLRSAIAATLLATAGVGYLCLKHQLHVAGARKKAMEGELRDLSAQSRVLDSRIADHTSSAALQQRLKEGFIKMVDIPRDAVVRIRLLPEAGNGSGGLTAMEPYLESHAALTRGASGPGEGFRPVAHSPRTAPRTSRQ